MSDNITNHVNSILAHNPDEPFLTWTPSERETREAVRDFLATEQGWLENAIKNDPALYNFDKIKKNSPHLLKQLESVNPDILEKLKHGSAEGLDELKKENPQLWLDLLKNPIQELLTYQGLHAIAWHRKAHTEYEHGNYAEARKISQGVRRITAGIEIHPGAEIGENFFIDHGTGVVIGETAKIGDNVMLYHRVTLGNDGTHMEGRRHPKIGNNVTIYTGADILGSSEIGDDVSIGAGVKVVGPVVVGDKAIINSQLYLNNDVEAGQRVIDSMKFGEPVYDREGDYKEGQKRKRGKWTDRARNDSLPRQIPS